MKKKKNGNKKIKEFGYIPLYEMIQTTDYMYALTFKKRGYTVIKYRYHGLDVYYIRKRDEYDDLSDLF